MTRSADNTVADAGLPVRTPAVVDNLYTAGELPYTIGSLCPTRAGGAYRPERF